MNTYVLPREPPPPTTTATPQQLNRKGTLTMKDCEFVRAKLVENPNPTVRCYTRPDNSRIEVKNKSGILVVTLAPEPVFGLPLSQSLKSYGRDMLPSDHPFYQEIRAQMVQCAKENNGYPSDAELHENRNNLRTLIRKLKGWLLQRWALDCEDLGEHCTALIHQDLARIDAEDADAN